MNDQDLVDLQTGARLLRVAVATFKRYATLTDGRLPAPVAYKRDHHDGRGGGPKAYWSLSALLAARDRMDHARPPLYSSASDPGV